MRAGLGCQDGFIRGVVWLGLVVAVAAVVLLDGMALFNARQSTEQSAIGAVDEARAAYYQTQDLARAEEAAGAYLTKNEKEMTGFTASESPDGTIVFNVSARGHAETYAFKYFGKLGLRSWVDALTAPTVTESST